jgi:diguanylate cyclase (GGDEF)-like protein
MADAIRGVWIAGHLSNGKWQQQKFNFEPLTLARIGNDVYIIGIHQEIQKFGSADRSLVFPVNQSSQIYNVQADRHDTLWIGCNDGLAYFRNGKGGVASCGLPKGAHVLSIDTSDPKYLWLGTDKGIARVEGDAYTSGSGSVTGLRSKLYGVDAGVPSNDCLQILRDLSGAIWVGGYFGIMSVEPDQFAAYDEHRIKSLHMRIYTAADGIHDYPGVMIPTRTGDGKLWFIGVRGVTMIDPSHLDHNSLAPPVVIEDATANGKTLSFKKPTSIKPGDGSFLVRYAGLSYIEPEKVEFRYRLDGFDTNWIDAGTRRSAAYTNLPPGRYTFRVIACNNDGVWNADGASVTFVLLPHFYETLWFRALLFLFAAATVVVLIFARTRQIERHARDLEHKVAERTSELVDTNRQLTTVQAELRNQNVQLQESQAEVEAQNEELQLMQAELVAQNDELVEVQAELVAQNEKLTSTQDILANANARLEALATTDGLTGLYNHRTFHELLEREWDRSERYGIPLSLILLDVDKFKQFNDTFGHPEGDEVLRSVARILKSTARESDLVARYGGEEFVVIAPETTGNEAVELAERLRAAVADAEWPLREITGSFGVAQVNRASAGASSSNPADNAPTPTPAQLIASADSALYASKHAGRNRVTKFGDEPQATGVASGTEQRAA